MQGGVGAVGKLARALHDDIDVERGPFAIPRIGVAGIGHRPTAEVERPGFGVALHGKAEAAMDRVILVEVSGVFDGAAVVDGDDLDIVPAAFNDRPRHQTPDPPEPADRNSNRHLASPSLAQRAADSALPVWVGA